MLGVDIIEISRIEKVMQENPRFLERIFTATEKAWATEYYTKRPAQHLAACWAAKEAFFKATNLKFKFGQIQVVHHSNRKPYLQSVNQSEFDIDWSNVQLSISHNNDYAIAVVILIK